MYEKCILKCTKVECQYIYTTNFVLIAALFGYNPQVYGKHTYVFTYLPLLLELFVK